MSEDILTEDDYKQVLYRRFNREDVKLLSYKIKPISEHVEGVAGDHYKVEINCEVDGDVKVEKFFLKTKPTKTEAQDELVSDLDMYQQEIFLFDFLLREFEKYGFDTSFAPKCYYCVPNQSLVLEDVTLEGFSSPPMYNVYDLEKCKCTLRSLALFHGAGYMYEEVKSKELGRAFRMNVEHVEYLGREKFFAPEKKVGIQWVTAVHKAFLVLIDCLPESKEYREEFKRKLSEVEFGKPFFEEHNIRKTLGHGDIWSNNMMFKYEDGVVKQCCLFDYQLLRYYYPTFDVTLFLHSATTREFRIEHWAELSKFYYTTLSDILSEHGHCIEDIYPEEDYKTSFKIAELEAKMQAFSDKTLSCFTQEEHFDQINSGNEDVKDIWYGDRTPHMLKAFNSNETYRKMIINCLYDLHEVLFKN